jgi:phosphoglucomutase
VFNSSSFVDWHNGVTCYVPVEDLTACRAALKRTGCIVKVYNFDPFVSFEGLKEYHNTLKEKHLDTLQSEVDKKVDLTNDQEISGVKTFTAPIKINTETVATQEWIKIYIEQYIKDNFATLMAEQVSAGALATEEVTATSEDVTAVFEEEEA